jgi:predicted flap endonuclease-1-like 5' DNA nuclease
MGLEWWCGLLLGLLFGWLSHALLDWFLGLRGAHTRFQSSLADVESERDRSEFDLGGVQRQLADKLGAHAKLEHDNTELRSRLGEFDANAAELAGLRLKLADLDAFAVRAPALEVERSEFKAKSLDLEVQLNASNAERSGLHARLEGLEKELTEVRGGHDQELAGFRKRAEDAEAAQARLNESLQRSASELSSVQAKLTDTGSAQGRLPELEMLVASMQAKLGETQGIAARLEAREAELLALQLRTADAEAARATGHELERQFIDLRNRFEAVEGERDWVKQELVTKEDEFAKLAGQLSAAQSAQTRATQLETDLLARDRELADLRAQTARLGASSTRVSELEQELRGTQRKLIDAETSLSSLNTLEAQHAALRQQMTELTPFRDRAIGLERETETLRNQIGELEKLRAELIEARKVPDDLTRVDGIGVVFAKRLNQAGITRFAQLAQTTPDALHEIIKPEDWQKIEFDHWTHDAAILAKGDTPLKRAKQNERLARITGIGEVYEKRLHDAGITTFAQLASTSADQLIEITGAENRTEVELWIIEAGAYAQGKRPGREREKVVRGRLNEAEGELDRLRGELRRADTLRRDRFEDMTQIGDAKQRRLYGAGIYLFEDLARAPESKLREIFENEDLDYPLISREAAEYARGEIIVVKGRRADRFERLTGVSEGDARLLHEAGVFSFEELAQLSSLRLQEIIGREGLERWITEAELFATGRAEIEFIDAGKHDRDQLWRINGIGEVFEVRMNKAGLFSFADVAASNPERLLEIINPQPWERIEPQSWVAQARELAAQEVKE